MSIFDKFRHHDDRPTLSGPNPNADELAQMRAEAAQSPMNQQLTEQQAVRSEAQQRAVEVGRAMLHNSEASGEVPIITPGMERPADEAPAESETESSNDDTPTGTPLAPIG